MNATNQNVGLIRWSVWLKSVGVDKKTGWRWRKEGRITPSVNLDGIYYLTSSDIEKFMAKAKAGEFAKEVRQPKNRK